MYDLILVVVRGLCGWRAWSSIRAACLSMLRNLVRPGGCELETRLSELLGEQTWRASGLGASEDVDQLTTPSQPRDDADKRDDNFLTWPRAPHLSCTPTLANAPTGNKDRFSHFRAE